MASKKVTISVPAKLFARATKRGPSFSGYVTELIAADLAREDMQRYLAELEVQVGVTDEDRSWAKKQLAPRSARTTARKAG
jgi:hypothetical protein